MTYTLRRTGLSDDPHDEDWQPHYKGVPVGRIYRTDKETEPRYRWSIYLNHRVGSAEGVAMMGYERSMDNAKAMFKQCFEKLIAAGKVKI